MQGILCSVLTCLVFTIRFNGISCVPEHGIYALSDEYIKKINEEQTFWKAGRNFKKTVTQGLLDTLVGGAYVNSKGWLADLFSIPRVLIENIKDELLKQSTIPFLPYNFDGRVDWPAACQQVVSTIEDTGMCASSWAIAVTQAIHDRYCIYHGRNDRTFSAKHLLECCAMCAHWNCKGGNQETAYEFLYSKGIPTGSNKFGIPIGCKPYSFKPASPCLMVKGSKKPAECKENGVFPCQKECSNKAYSFMHLSVDADTFKIYTYFRRTHEFLFFFNDNNAIKAEIKNYGSVTAMVTIFDDFLNYKAGVYYPTSRVKRVGEITVRLIGWGNEKGYDYWLAANTWGPQWGDRGFVKLRAMDPKMNIEDRIYVGRVAPP